MRCHAQSLVHEMMWNTVSWNASISTPNWYRPIWTIRQNNRKLPSRGLSARPPPHITLHKEDPAPHQPMHPASPSHLFPATGFFLHHLHPLFLFFSHSLILYSSFYLHTQNYSRVSSLDPTFTH